MRPTILLCLALMAGLGRPSDLPAPSNVRIDSYNMKHVVRWDPVEVKNERIPVRYSVEFEIYKASCELCSNITEMECNFTEKIPHYFKGKLKVRTELGSRRSDWVVLPDFQPSKDTTIGPVKSLILHSHSGKLTVNFSPPFSPIPSIWTMNYILFYWKENSGKEVEVDLHSATTYLLDNLEKNANYCVKVYAFTHYIKGLMSDPVCEITHTEITLFVVLGCVFGAVFIFAVIGLFIVPGKPLYKAFLKIKIWLDGPYRIPSDIIEYLEDAPPSVFMECPLNISCEQYDRLSIVGLDLSQDNNEETCPDDSQQGLEKT
ncbi:interferon gamma receptor 2 isoform X2 [Pyxicephalus adspersus]|uniref:interferon gamma receptor 2 isoform X2 n=1 Tax=Pyxicephalus adspersus TaxID=30357 RepID=UPI003B5A1C38